MTRKTFLKYVASTGVLSAFFFWKKSSDINVKKKIKLLRLKNEFKRGISFTDKLIINKTENNIFIYSNKCTHLGCRIDTVKSAKLICPCHGSQFDTKGQVVKGPALTPLKKLKYRIDEKSNELVVEL